MRFIIENVDPEYIEQLVKVLKDCDALIDVGVENIHTTFEWVVILMFEGGFREEELRKVVSFEFLNFHTQESLIMSVLTSCFEGSNLLISSPDLPGLRIEFA